MTSRSRLQLRGEREFPVPSLVQLEALALFAERAQAEKLERAALRWHGRLETESATLTMAASQLALAALASLCAGERDAGALLRS